MKRPTGIQLALMGGGVVLTLGGGIALLSRDPRACRDARAANLPNAEEICVASGASSSSSSSGSSGRSWFSSSGGSSSSSASVSRGGFGSTAHSSGS